MSQMGSLRRNLLIVDANDAVRESLHHAFSLVNYQVLSATGGTQALEKLANQAADVFLLDLDSAMEGEGMALASHLADKYPARPVIGMTTDLGQRVRTLGNSLAAVIEKPLDMPALLEQVDRLVGQPPTDPDNFSRPLTA